MNIAMRDTRELAMTHRPMAAETPPDTKPGAVSPLLFPLDEFYVRQGRAVPAAIALEGVDVPEPYRSLLVHSNDMTPTLEAFHGDTLHVHVLYAEERGDHYHREVLLELDGTNRAVEYGAIRINLALLPADARRDVLAARQPLGHILRAHRIAHASRPKAYLRFVADEHIGGVLRLSDRPVLFGRRNTLTERGNLPLAEIVEILPPEPAS